MTEGVTEAIESDSTLPMTSVCWEVYRSLAFLRVLGRYWGVRAGGSGPQVQLGSPAGPP